jgi:hypothetical protein
MAAAMCVASCGDSNDGPDASPATITQENATVIAADALQAAFATSAFGGDIRSSSIGGIAAGSSSGTSACAGSGTVAVSGEIQDELTLTSNDRITADFDACDDGDGTVLDGLLELIVQSFSGDIEGMGDFAARFAVILSGLALSDGEDTFVADGDLTLDLSFDVATGEATTTIFGEILDLDAGHESWHLRDFAATAVIESLGVVMLTTTGNLLSSGIDGTVEFVTTEPFLFDVSAPDTALAGELLVSGADGATITVRQNTDNGEAILDIDADGDGETDATLDVPWSALLAA